MERIDRLLVSLKLADSRTQAQRYISENRVLFERAGEWKAVKKPSEKFDAEVQFRVEKDESDRFVSRGGLKLAEALEKTELDITGMTVIDVGQSTGGFTDCAIQSGAAKVVGIEVGHGQLVDKLRKDTRVVCLEGMNGRELPLDLLQYTEDEQGFDLAVMDVSFISQTRIIPALAPLIRSGGHFITLVKPQFEVGKEGLGKGGIVRDESLYPQVENLIKQSCIQHGFSVQNYFDSPIKGGDGNREFLLYGIKH